MRMRERFRCMGPQGEECRDQRVHCADPNRGYRAPVVSARRASYASRMVVVYDADCGVCQASVAWLKERDRKGVFKLVGNDVPDLPPGVSREETNHTVIVLDGARKLVRAEAVARILDELPGWSAAGALIMGPTSVAGSSGSPTLSFLAAATNSSRNFS